jgi:hypothetical protein
VRHLLQILAGRASAIEIEQLGDDERGVEFWVTRPDGTREGHQCKRENGVRGMWSVADLAAKNVISNALFQLKRDPSHHFIFASADKAALLSDLAERAKQPYCPDDNRIERKVWREVHANVTVNHRCRTIEELMREAVYYLMSHNRRARSRVRQSRAAI